jgi:hypothetical protein
MLLLLRGLRVCVTVFRFCPGNGNRVIGDQCGSRMDFVSGVPPVLSIRTASLS